MTEKQNQIQLYINSGHKIILLPYGNAVIVRHKVTNDIVTITEEVDHFTMIRLLNDNCHFSIINDDSFEIQLHD